MISTPSEGNWPVTFPGNLRWSNATQIVKGMVAYGAAAMAEIDLITQRLKARAGESDLGVNARRIRNFIARLKAET